MFILTAGHGALETWGDHRDGRKSHDITPAQHPFLEIEVRLGPTRDVSQAAREISPMLLRPSVDGNGVSIPEPLSGMKSTVSPPESVIAMISLLCHERME
jgi:hypothetical protein